MIVNAAQEHYQAADKGVICIRFVLMVSKGGCSVPYPSASFPWFLTLKSNHQKMCLKVSPICTEMERISIRDDDTLASQYTTLDLKPDIGRSTGFPWAWGSCCCILTPYTLSSSRKSFLWTSFPWQEWPSLRVAFASGATDAWLATSNVVAQESQLMVTGRSRSRENFPVICQLIVFIWIRHAEMSLKFLLCVWIDNNSRKLTAAACITEVAQAPWEGAEIQRRNKARNPKTCGGCEVCTQWALYYSRD